MSVCFLGEWRCSATAYNGETKGVISGAAVGRWWETVNWVLFLGGDQW